MNAANDDIGPKGLRGWWATPPRSGMQLLIFPWEYRHLRAWGITRLSISIVPFCLGLVTISLGGDNATTYGWTAFFMVLAGLMFAWGHWYMSIARSAPRRA